MFYWVLNTEAVARRRSRRKGVLKNFAKFRLSLQLLLKKGSDTIVFLWILQNFPEHLVYGTPSGYYFCKYASGLHSFSQGYEKAFCLMRNMQSNVAVAMTIWFPSKEILIVLFFMLALQSINLLKVSSKRSRVKCEVCSKLLIKKAEWFSIEAGNIYPSFIVDLKLVHVCYRGVAKTPTNI